MRLLLAATLTLLAFAATPAAIELPEGAAPLAPAEPLFAPVARDALPGDAPLWWAPPFDPMVPAEVAATAAGGAALLLVGLGLYSRLARGQLLDHERRDAVYKLVQGGPGISLTDIAQRTGLGWGATVYHLERLEKGGFLSSEKSGAKRCFFPVGAVARDARAPLATLREEQLRVVATYVHERPGTTQGEMADALGISASAASKQVTKLESAGLVLREREWKTVRLLPGPKLAELLQPAGRATP